MREPKNNRRRGADLLESLYEVVLELLEQVKPTSLTFHQIAKAAGTSRTVLYRRWPAVFDLLQEVYTHKARKLFDGAFFNHLADTGSMRGDFVQLLTCYQQLYEEVGVDTLNNYYYLRMQDKENQHEPAVHTTAVAEHLQAVADLLKRAEGRGEPVKRVGMVTLMLPFDLLRIENLIRPGNMGPERIETLVAEVLLPVFRQHVPGGNAQPAVLL